MSKRTVIIIGAAGRDFHNFNVYYRDNGAYNVVAFTATQIPDIAGRGYPPELGGKLYPEGIPIYAEEDLPRLIKDLHVDECNFAYSDVSYQHVMSVSAIVEAAGASFVLLGPKDTMLRSSKPVIAVGAVRTGCGKSQTSRRITEILKEKGIKVVVIRHPMPYGDLVAQKVQRFAELSDLEKHKCTIEEMEEYEPHIVHGNVVYAGVDYEAILREAENDPDGCDVILWDGGNNEFPFYAPRPASDNRRSASSRSRTALLPGRGNVKDCRRGDHQQGRQCGCRRYRDRAEKYRHREPRGGCHRCCLDP